jgi:anti-sigma factor RsiW
MIMDCRQCRDDLTAYLDGELNPADSAEVRSHLETCTSCADELRSFQHAADFVESHKRELELSPGSWNLVRARISSSNSLPSSRFLVPNRWRFAFASLAIIATVALGYFWYQQAQERNLDAYISQYIRIRESRQHFQPENPFMEVSANLDANPFRSEDR